MTNEERLESFMQIERYLGFGYLAPEKPPITDRVLPQPASKYGFTYAQLQTFFTEDELKEFGQWMRDQTCCLDDELGGAIVYYAHDVERFVSGRRRIID